MPATIATIDLVGGNVCLDFANTLDSRAKARPEEYLASYADLIAWSRRATGLPDEVAEQFLAAAARQPADAATALRQAIALREAIYRCFHAVERGAPLPAAPLATLNVALALALAHARVVNGPAGPAWAWSGQARFDAPLWPVARAAAELLTSSARVHVRECASETCSWLFLDTTRNHSRRYCSMADCGNRARARRHYAKRRASR